MRRIVLLAILVAMIAFALNAGRILVVRHLR
jgi:hypothetical protein